MSRVTNIILSFDIIENSREEENEDIFDLMDDINQWLTEHRYGSFKSSADRVSGGTKCIETPIYIAAFNYFDVDGFVAFLKTLRWQCPENVQVFIQGQEEDKFTLFELSAQ